MGFAISCWDILRGAHFDLLRPEVLAVLLSWIASGKIVMLTSGTPCSSHSRARRAPQWSRMPHQLRSEPHVYGLPHLTGKDAETGRTGNKLSSAVQKNVSACVAAGVPGWEENPGKSWLWEQYGRVKRSKDPIYCEFDLDQCPVGSSVRKHTRISTWHCGLAAKPRFAAPAPEGARGCVDPSAGILTEEDLRCTSRLCRFTGRRHVVLSGLAQGVFKTTAAAAYSSRLALFLAQLTAHAIWRKQLGEKWKSFNG